MRKHFLPAVAVALSFTLTACSDEDTRSEQVSAECIEAFEAMADVPIEEDTSSENLATLTACGSYEEWLAAAIKVPGATGFTAKGIREPSNQEIAIQVSCEADPESETPVCSDASAQGVLR